MRQKNLSTDENSCFCFYPLELYWNAHKAFPTSNLTCTNKAQLKVFGMATRSMHAFFFFSFGVPFSHLSSFTSYWTCKLSGKGWKKMWTNYDSEASLMCRLVSLEVSLSFFIGMMEFLTARQADCYFFTMLLVIKYLTRYTCTM